MTLRTVAAANIVTLSMPDARSPASALAVEMQGVTRDFGAVRALDDVSLTIPVGTIFGFLGANGAGKTTTLRLLLGLIRPTAGRAEVVGFDTQRDAEAIRARTGTLLEHTGLYERLTALQNLDYHRRINRIPGALYESRSRELLGRFGLWDRRHDVVGKWSRGMKQKLAVARALLAHPPLVFLDEPTAGLDPEATVSLREDLVALAHSEGTTLFVTTHNLAEAEKMCGLVGVLRAGRLLALGTPSELRARVRRSGIEIVGSRFTGATLERLRASALVESARVADGILQLTLRNDADPAPLVAMLIADGASVSEVRRTASSLEDAYMALMEKPDAV